MGGVLALWWSARAEARGSFAVLWSCDEMRLPVVAIVGRPNVGKSSLLNCIARRMIGIVDPTPGVTRDRVSTVCNFADVYFELIDTG